jgi:hypothetical protein
VSGLFISSLTMIVCCGYMLELINFFFFLLMQRISCPPFFLSFFRSGGGRIEAQTDKRTFGSHAIIVFFWCVLVACFLLGKKEKGLEGFSLRNLFSLLIPRTLFCMQFS